MIKHGFVLLLSALTVSSCGLPDRAPCNATTVTTPAPAEEVTALKQFIDSTRTTTIADKRGFYYTIQSSGVGTKPTVCSTVTVNYVGKLTNGTTFDSGNGIRFDLNQLIVGWLPYHRPG